MKISEIMKCVHVCDAMSILLAGRIHGNLLALRFVITVKVIVWMPYDFRGNREG